MTNIERLNRKLAEMYDEEVGCSTFDAMFDEDDNTTICIYDKGSYISCDAKNIENIIANLYDLDDFDEDKKQEDEYFEAIWEVLSKYEI